MRQYTDQTIILNAVAANGASAAISMAAFRHIELQLATTGFTGTVKFAGSNADTAPDFGAAASATNPWSFVQAIDQIDGSTVAGGTGEAYTTDTSVKNLELNVNGMKWIAAIVSGWSVGSLTVKGKGYNDGE